MQQNQRHLNFNKFIEQRSIEISKFLTELQMDTKKKGHQALPKSIRRRAMSHNRFRIPRKMRKNMQQDLVKAENMQKLPKCRKHIRKRRHLITAYKMRDAKNKWLSTHLWAAKRMRMTSYHGYKIAFTPNDKSFRSAYRHFRHNCCMVDLSYQQCLAFRVKNRENFSLPANVVVEGEWNDWSFDKIYCVKIFSEQTHKQMICPAYMIRAKDDEYAWSFKVIFDPICLDQIKRLKLPNQFIANLQESQIDIYYLTGPQTINVLNSSIKQYGVVQDDYNIGQHLYSHKNKLVYLSKQENYSINNKPLIDFPLRQEKVLKKAYDPSQNINIRKNMMALFQKMTSKRQCQQEDNSIEDFWKYYEQGQNKALQDVKFKVTLRSKYTHKRKNKLSKLQKRKVLELEKQSPVQKKKRRKNDSEMKDQNDAYSESGQTSKVIFAQTPTNLKNACIEAANPILIAQVHKSQLFKGVLVFCSNANSCRLWRIITHQNVKVIGRRQYAHMHLQSNQLLFPQNFAGTKSFSLHQQTQALTNFNKFIKVPIQKRPHYYQLHSQNPFSAIIPSNSQIISIEMVSRGRCFQNSYICEITTSDLSAINQKLFEGKLGIVASEKIQENQGRKMYKLLEQANNDFHKVTTARKIIGSITSGGFLYSKCHEGGLGFINRDLLSQNYLQKMGNYVLIRKVSSPYYMLGQITRFFQHV